MILRPFAMRCDENARYNIIALRSKLYKCFGLTGVRLCWSNKTVDRLMAKRSFQSHFVPHAQIQSNGGDC